MATSVWQDTNELDWFFVRGRRMWPDLEHLSGVKLDRSKVSDKVVTFIKSTALNEHGIVHYVRRYLKSYADDYNLGLWGCIWGGEEYLHSVVLRLILKNLGEGISEREYTGLETGSYGDGYGRYLQEKSAGPAMSPRIETLIYGVLQEFVAYKVYSAVSRACEEPTVKTLLLRVARDEARHCRFFQRSLESAAPKLDPAEYALIWPQFDAFFKDLRMPQDFIELFAEEQIGTDLYTGFWDRKDRTEIAIYLGRFFKQFRKPFEAASSRVGA